MISLSPTWWRSSPSCSTYHSSGGWGGGSRMDWRSMRAVTVRSTGGVARLGLAGADDRPGVAFGLQQSGDRAEFPAVDAGRLLFEREDRGEERGVGGALGYLLPAFECPRCVELRGRRRGRIAGWRAGRLARYRRRLSEDLSAEKTGTEMPGEEDFSKLDDSALLSRRAQMRTRGSKTPEASPVMRRWLPCTTGQLKRSTTAPGAHGRGRERRTNERHGAGRPCPSRCVRRCCWQSRCCWRILRP